MNPVQEWWSRRSVAGRIATVAAGVVVALAALGAVLPQPKSDQQATGTAATQATRTTTTHPTQSAARKPPGKTFQCSAKSVPVVCRIAQKQLDIPLMAVATVGVPEGGLGVSYSLGLPPHAHANQVVLAATEAQMGLVYDATVKTLGDRDIGFIDAAAFVDGDTPFKDSPAFATSIGRSQIQQVVNGSSPIDVWRVDGISPLFTQAGARP